MKILLAIDGSECSQLAVSYLARLVPLTGVEVHVATVAETRGSPRGYRGIRARGGDPVIGRGRSRSSVLA